MSLSGYSKRFEGLETLILWDQHFITCPNDLPTFIKEKGRLDLRDIFSHAENYIEAHETDVNHKVAGNFLGQGFSRMKKIR